MQVSTKLTLAQTQAAATAFGLTSTEFATIAVHEFESRIHGLTAYPGNARGIAFLELLLDREMAT